MALLEKKESFCEVNCISPLTDNLQNADLCAKRGPRSWLRDRHGQSLGVRTFPAKNCGTATCRQRKSSWISCETKAILSSLMLTDVCYFAALETGAKYIYSIGAPVVSRDLWFPPWMPPCLPQEKATPLRCHPPQTHHPH